MKKLNLFKKVVSLLLAVLMITSTVCITMNTVAADYYIEKIQSFDIFNQNITGTSKNTFSMNPLTTNITGLSSSKYSYIPYNMGAQMVWNIENVSSFSVHTFNSNTITEADLLNYYVLQASSNGTNWTSLTVSKDPSYKVTYNSFVSYKLSATDIPEDTKYIKLTSNYTGGSAWCYGIIHAEYGNKELLPEPEIKAVYKNLYGAYANPLKSGGKATDDVRIKLNNMGADVGAEVTIKKNGSKVNKDNYYDAVNNAYFFNENGEYHFSAKNYAGTVDFDFTLNKNSTGEFVITKTIVDDIYNTGKSIAISRTNYANETTRIVMDIVKSSSYNITHLLPGNKYLMFPYNSGSNEPGAEAVWYSDIGFGTFTVETLNTTSLAVGDFYERTYSFFTSDDGVTWSKVDFKVGDTLTTGEVIGSAISKEIIIDEIPDGTKYIKFLSLITDDTKNNGLYSGIIRAKYTTYISLPKIDARFESVAGGFINPVSNGATVPSNVKIDFNDVDMDVFGSFSVLKEGKGIPFNSGDVLTENGNYEVVAQNLKGESTLSFTIDSSLASTKTDTYVFSEGVANATEEFERLLAEQPAGAPEDFTKGDRHVIINDTAIVKKYDEATNAWWGLTSGQTKLSIGSDSKGYNKDGYFYFINKDENGNKYTGITLKHTRARMSSYPTDAYFTVYTADSFDGEYKLVKPISFTTEPVTGAPAVDICNAVYYLGGAGTIVKIKFNPMAPSNSLWQGSMLSILQLSKLSMPLIEANASGKKLVYNDIVQSNVKLNVSDEDYWFITKDGKDYEKPADGVLKEDGYYTVTACNYGGTASVSFYIAKKIPVVQIKDASGNNLDSGEATDNDVKVTVYNSDDIQILKDGVFYSSDSNVKLDLNGKYTIIAENENGIYQTTVTINRPQPTIKAYNLQGKQLADGDSSVSTVTYVAEYQDTCTITINGEKYIHDADTPLTREGLYVIEVENKAGKASISFTLKFNPSLPEIEHAGNTVAVINYEKGDPINKFLYKYFEMYHDSTKGIQSTWTGFTGPVIRSTITGDAEGYIIYKCVGFKSFAVYAVYDPVTGMTVSDMYDIYASSNGKDFTKLEYTTEHDISYQTTGYVKYRLNVTSVPENTKYIKVSIKGNNAKAAWSRCIPKVEFSYDKEKVGKLDVEDVLFMLDDIDEGGEVNIDLLNDDIVIPKKVFEKIQDADKSLTVNIISKDLTTEYKLSFNGLEVTEPMDFNIKLTSTNNEALSTMKKYDKNAKSVSFAQGGNWTVKAQLTMLLNSGEGGKKYALYKYSDGQFELIDRMAAPATGLLVYTVSSGGEYIFTQKVDLLDDTTSSEQLGDYSEDTTQDYSQDDIQEEIEEQTQNKSKGTYVMVVNRKKFVPSENSESLSVLTIVLICVGALVVIGGATVTTLLIIKKRKNSIGRK